MMKLKLPINAKTMTHAIVLVTDFVQLLDTAMGQPNMRSNVFKLLFKICQMMCKLIKKLMKKIQAAIALLQLQMGFK